MLKSIPISNKLLCMEVLGENLYLGDAGGVIHLAKYPFTIPVRLITTSAPVSSIAFLNGEIFYGTWDGCINSINSKKKLGIDPIKCIKVYKERLFVSVDKYVFVLDKNLSILEEIRTPYKVLCMDKHDGKLWFGLGTGMLAAYTNRYESEEKTGHETNILAIRNGITGSADGTMRRGEEVLYSGKGWIRSIFDETLFSAGRSVYENGKILYDHQADVMDAIRICNKIISIGLDRCYKIYDKGGFTDEKEEDEILRLLNE